MTNDDQTNQSATSPTNGEAVRSGDWVGDAGEEIPYKRAKGLAVAEAEIRVKWWNDAYDFWTARLCAAGDDEASRMREHVYRAWSAATDALNELKREGVVVGGSWLVRATFEQLAAKSPSEKPCDETPRQ